MRRAAFLDRDGVINSMVVTSAGIDSPQHPSEFRLLPGVVDAIGRLNRLGLPVVVVSNQPGIAKGKSTLAFLEQTTMRLHASLHRSGAFVDAVYYCLHHPNAIVREYLVQCDCRKPKPGLLLQAARDLGLAAGSYMVGDRLTDIIAGRAVGCQTILISDVSGMNGPIDGLTTAEPDAVPDHTCGSLSEAVRWIETAEAAWTDSSIDGRPAQAWKSSPTPPVSWKFSPGFNVAGGVVHGTGG